MYVVVLLFWSIVWCTVCSVTCERYFLNTSGKGCERQSDRTAFIAAQPICRLVLFFFKMRKKTFEMSVLRDITHLRSCHYTTLTHVRTQTKPRNQFDLLNEMNERTNKQMNDWSNCFFFQCSLLGSWLWPIIVDRSIKLLKMCWNAHAVSHGRNCFNVLKILEFRNIEYSCIENEQIEEHNQQLVLVSLWFTVFVCSNDHFEKKDLATGQRLQDWNEITTKWYVENKNHKDDFTRKFLVFCVPFKKKPSNKVQRKVFKLNSQNLYTNVAQEPRFNRVDCKYE